MPNENKLNKLAKVNDSFTVNMYDNGFMIEISGYNANDEWMTAKFVCTSMEQAVAYIKQLADMPRS